MNDRSFSWYRQWLRIADRHTLQLTEYRRNAIQRDLDTHLVGTKPVRLIVLKARRFGVSTGIQMRFAHLAMNATAFHGLTGAHDDNASTYLHGMVETAYANLPPAMRPPKQTGIQGKRIVFQHGSSLRTFTAGGREGVGRATAATALHGSEVAYWPDAKGTLGALLQIVPDEPGTIVALESTANGVGNEFHRLWLAAENGSSDYQAVFYPWHAFPDYRRHDAGDGCLLDLDERESGLRAQGVGLDQLAWRRWAIANLCSGDANLFDQEYPDTPGVAFLTTGRPFFAPENVARCSASDPIRVGRVTGDPVRGSSKATLRFEDHSAGDLRIWSTPKPGRRYVIGADAAGGVTLDEHQARDVGDGDDYSCAQVIDAETGDQVAEWHARIDGDLFGVELARLGYLYNSALVAVEDSGGYGIAPLAALKRVCYPNLYQRQILDERSGEWTDKLGWATSTRTRPVLVETLQAWLREEPHTIHSSSLVSEMRTFVRRRNGTPGADTGCHDDRVMALGIAHEVRREALPVRINSPKRRQERPKFAAEVAA